MSSGGKCHLRLLLPTPLHAAHSAGIWYRYARTRDIMWTLVYVGFTLRLFLLGPRSLRHPATLPTGSPTGFFTALQRAPGVRRRSWWLPSRFDDTLLL